MTRLLIFYAKPKLTNQTTGPRSDHNGQPTPNSMEASVTTEDAKGQLGSLATLVTRSAVERRTLQCLLKNEVGMFELEATALKINSKGSKKPMHSNISRLSFC